MLTAMGVSLFASAMNVRYRDVGHAIPFVIQIWMFVSPIVYPVSLVPERWRLLYGLNPMVGVIEGFRWALLGQTAPDLVVMAASASRVFRRADCRHGVFQTRWNGNLRMSFEQGPRILAATPAFFFSTRSD